MSGLCWVCGESCDYQGRRRTTRDACHPCSSYLRRVYGDSWDNTAREMIAEGRQAELIPKTRGRRAIREDRDLPAGAYPLPLPYVGPVKPFTVPKYCRDQAEAKARRIAREEGKNIIAIHIGSELVGGSLYFERFINAKGDIDVRPCPTT